MHKLTKDRFRLRVGLVHPPDSEDIGIVFVARLMMDLTIDGGEEGSNILDLVIDHALERGGISAKRDRREINDQIALHDLFGNDAVVIICIAHAGTAHPAEEITRTLADLLLA